MDRRKENPCEDDINESLVDGRVNSRIGVQDE